MSEADDILAAMSEPALPTPAWNGQSGDPHQVLEKDLRGLMHQLADVRLDLEQASKRHDNDIQEILLAVLDVGDAFDRVFHDVKAKEDQVTPRMKKWLDNFRTVRRKLDSVLTDRGVKQIQSLDVQFDPLWHQVVDTVAAPTKSEGSIAEEVKAGYLWNRAILRKAEVVVVRNEAN